jgi:hypothetical protein
MAFVLKDRVRETTAVIGTGPATLLGTTGGFQSFGNAMSVGDTCWYGIVHLGVAWETGIGTYSGANTLTRTTVVESSNGNAAVSFTAGGKDVFISAMASKIVTIDQAQTLTNKTLGATTLNGTVSGGGNSINNVVIGASTPLAGTFTALAAGTDGSTANIGPGNAANGSAALVLTGGTGAGQGSYLVFSKPSVPGWFFGHVSRIEGSGTVSDLEYYNANTTVRTIYLNQTDDSVKFAAGVIVGTPTGGYKGVGTLNLASGLYINGVAATGAGTVTSIVAGTGLTGGTITGSGTVALSLANATLQAQPTNPTGTTSATGVMMGLGGTCKITPVYSGRVKIEFYSSAYSGASTGHVDVTLKYGTGTAPANGAVITGTTVGTTILGTTANVGYPVPISTGGIITGLTPGTAYWFDVVLAGNSTTTNTVTSISFNVMEF